MPYPLGWSVVPQTLVRRERWVGGKSQCIPLVYPGQVVLPDQPVIRLEPLEASAASPVPNSYALSDANTSTTFSQLQEKQGKLAAHDVRASEMVPAGLRGRVVDITRCGGVIIESQAAVVQGLLGIGHQVVGILTMWSVSDSSQGQAIPPGALLCIPGPVNIAMLRSAMNSGVVGVIASSISTSDLEGFIQADLIHFLTRSDMKADQNPPSLPNLTLMLTEGLGTMAMPAQTIYLLSQYQGAIALLSGTTSIARSIYPELIISLPEHEATQLWQPVTPDPEIALGARVRVCSGNYEGVTGKVNYLFTHQQEFYSGIRARAARLCLDDGSTIVLPLTILERVG